MIVRTALRCGTCDCLHVVRIGMGHEERNAHRFQCRGCQQDILVALEVDYEAVAHRVVLEENAVWADEAPDAAIVNLDANFLIPEDQQGVDYAMPRLGHIHELLERARDAGQIPLEVPFDSSKLGERPYRRADYAAEWKELRAAWNLHRNGKVVLSRAKIRSGTKSYYPSDALSDLPDWVWRMALQLTTPKFERQFIEAVDALKPILDKAEFKRFSTDYGTKMTSTRALVYFKIMNSYFNAYADFAQVQFMIRGGIEIDNTLKVTSADFERTQMFYGNAFEAFGDLVNFLVFANNMLQGRPYDGFAQLTLKKYYELDKKARFNVLSGTPSFSALCIEADNQLRNASHHGGMSYDAADQIIIFHVGKGGQGAEQSISYAEYLGRCVTMFMQIMTLLRIELVICSTQNIPCPL